MWKLIKMDFYRLFTSKTLKVGALMAAIICALYMLASMGIIALTKYYLESDPKLYEDMVAMGEFLPQIAWFAGGVNFSEILFSTASFFSLFIGCMITANFIGSEQSCGYTKNFAGQLPDKGYMALSKFIVTSVAQILIIIVYTIVAAALAFPLLGRYIEGFSITPLLATFGLMILLYLAINAIIVFVCMITKSHAIAMVIGCIFGIGATKLAYHSASALLSMMKIKFEIAEFMPDGVWSMLTLDSYGSVASKAIGVSLCFIAVFLTASFIVLRKRDIR